MTAPYIFWGVLTTTIIALLALRGQIMRHRFYEYIHGGYLLLKKEPKLFYFVLVVALTSSFAIAPPPFLPPLLWQIAGVITFFISIGLNWGYPLFLLKIKKGVKITGREYFATIWTSFARAFPQIIVLMVQMVLALIVFSIAFFAIAIGVTAAFGPKSISAPSPMTSDQLLLYMLGISTTASIIFSLFRFSTFFFALEKWSVWKSVTQSPRFVLRHKSFILWFLILEIITLTIAFSNPWKTSSISVFIIDTSNSFMHTVMLNALFLYYQKNIQPHITGADAKADVQRAEA